MGALRRGSILALLLAGGCGDDGTPTWSGTFDLELSIRPDQLSVTAWLGTVRLRNSTNGKVEVTVRGKAPLPPDKLITVSEPAREPMQRSTSALTEIASLKLVVNEAAKDTDLVIDIAAPPGTFLSCACAAANVEVGGAWGALEVRTAGAITARVERADSGTLDSRSGAVLYTAAAGPTGELYARAGKGDVTIRLPASWNGQIDCTTQGGKLDVPPHKNLNTIWDEDKKHVVGRVGPRGGDRTLPTVWGAGRGSVSLRFED